MKVLLISPYLPLKDGLAAYSAQLAGTLRTAGHTVDIISTKSSPEALAATGFSPRVLWRMYRAIRNARPDIVHVQYAIPAFGLASFPLWLVLGLMRLTMRTKLVITFHEVKRETALLGPAGAVYMRFVAKLAHGITVHTQEAMKILGNRCGVDPAKITCIPHPLYTALRKGGHEAALRKRFKLGRNPVVLLFGFIHVDKGIDHLIAAFAHARRTDKRLENARLVIAGSVRKRTGLFRFFEKHDIAYETRLHQMVAELGVQEQVLFTPYVPDEQVGSWFRLADVNVLPYTNLEQSGVLNLALACRTPIIASDLGGLGETLRGTPCLVPPADDNALAAALVDVLTDRKVRNGIVAEYDRISAERTLDVVCAALEDLYRRLQKEDA